MMAASTVPMLKPGEFEIWRMRIEQYIQMMDYALWDVIENGPILPKTQVMEGMMGILNEHQLKFNSIKDAKQLMEAIEERFGGNDAIKKTQKNLLKQQYKNFTASNSEMLDQTFNRLQKLVSQLELLGEKLSQEDVNQKLLRSLSPEWNTHVVVWMNKADLDIMSIDDLYNNLKVYEPEVKGFNTAQAVNTALRVSTSGTQVNTANIDNLSDVVICAFVASQPSSPQLVNEDLEQIHPDDLEEIDLRWQMAMLTMRARRFLKKIERKLTVNGNDNIGFDKSNVECYNFHKRGHFAKECRALKSQDTKHKKSTRRIMPVKTHASTGLVSSDGLGGYDWSDQAEEGPNYAPMAYTSTSLDSNVSTDSTCTKSFLETVKILKSQNEQLTKDIKKSELMVLGYKSGLDEFANKPVVENCDAKTSETKPNDDKGAIDSGCSRHMTRNMSYLTDYEKINGGYVAFGGNLKGGKITGNCTIRTDHLGKFDSKVDEGFFVGYSLSSKAFRVLNSRKMIVEKNLHIRFSENAPNVVGSGPDWLFDIDALTRTINYEPIAAGTQSNSFVRIKSSQDNEFQPSSDSEKKVDEDPSKGSECRDQEHDDNVNDTNNVNAASINRVNVVSENISNELPFDPNMHALKDISTFNFLSDHKDDDEEADMNNMDTTIQVSTTASSLEAEQNSGNINKTQSSATSNESSSQQIDTGGSPSCQDTMEDTIAQTRSERVSKLSNDLLFAREKTKTTQALEINSLKRRVKKPEKKQRSRTHKLKRLYKVGLSARVESSNDNEDLGKDASKHGRKIHDINADEDITLVNDQDDEQMFDVNDLQGEEVFVQEDVADKEVNTAGEVNTASVATTNSAATIMTIDEVTLAQALMEIKSTKPKAKGIVLQEPSELKQKQQQQQFLQRNHKTKPNSLKNKSFANIQELFDKAMKRVNTFVDYRTELVEESFKKAKAEVMEGSSKRAGTELEQESSKRVGTKLDQESSKKQKIDDDKEKAELKQLVKIIPDEEGVAIDAIHLAVKPPSIVD
uniref:Retroviral polymerase SH3-like domain-containing protein n=1 Tax=Tanacetum cinerariifolium TaxID=118510 RepID=A0A699GJF1_TANCI|nr:hypothetical protein [Tanacetum cinerariifolium]